MLRIGRGSGNGRGCAVLSAMMDQMKLSIVSDDSFFLRFAGFKAWFSVCLRFLPFSFLGDDFSAEVLVDSAMSEFCAVVSEEVESRGKDCDMSGREMRGSSSRFKS